MIIRSNFFFAHLIGPAARGKKKFDLIIHNGKYLFIAFSSHFNIFALSRTLFCAIRSGFELYNCGLFVDYFSNLQKKFDVIIHNVTWIFLAYSISIMEELQ